MRRAGLISAILLVPALAAASMYLYIQVQLEQPLAIDDTTAIDIPQGSSLMGVSVMLAERGILPAPRLFTWHGRLTGKAARVQAGEYEIVPGTTPAALLEQLVTGRVRLHALTIIEGWTFRDMLEALRSHPAVKVTLNDVNDAELMDRLERSQHHPEGMFFPDTYRFPRQTTDLEILDQASDRLWDELESAWASRSEGLPLATPYEALILASIVEKETGLDSERATIAGVFVRRLERGMRLQTDPTVIYGLGATFDGDIRRKDLETDTPYNTYTRRGLPPTPISLPGSASIHAVMHPDRGDALFFVATGEGDGSHYFSRTFEEHQQAVQRYLSRQRQER